MDQFDQAQDLELTFREMVLKNHKNKMPRGPSEKYCLNPRCGDEIPAERRAAISGVQYCLECQEHKERYGRLP